MSVNEESDGLMSFHRMGHERGMSAGSWVFDGNTSEDHIRKVLDGYNDGDPEVMDYYPSPLSGEWGGTSLIELGLGDADQEELDAYEQGYVEGFWEEVQRSGAAMLGEEGS